MNELVNKSDELMPLTKEQLFEMRGKAVLVTHIDGTPMLYGMDRIAAILDSQSVYGNKNDIMAIYANHFTLGGSEYGLTWIAYPYEPFGKSEQKNGVVHGHWIFKDSTGGGFTEPIDTYICSKCGKVSEMSCAYISKDNFCKNCGAKMDEDTEREDDHA